MHGCAGMHRTDQGRGVALLGAGPHAPVSAVAARAGVGIGALYHRYASKEDLLRTLCRAADPYVTVRPDMCAIR